MIVIDQPFTSVLMTTIEQFIRRVKIISYARKHDIYDNYVGKGATLEIVGTLGLITCDDFPEDQLLFTVKIYTIIDKRIMLHTNHTLWTLEIINGEQES